MITGPHIAPLSWRHDKPCDFHSPDIGTHADLCGRCGWMRKEHTVTAMSTTVTFNGITITNYTGRQTEDELRAECEHRARQLGATWRPSAAATGRPPRDVERSDDEGTGRRW